MESILTLNGDLKLRTLITPELSSFTTVTRLGVLEEVPIVCEQLVKAGDVQVFIKEQEVPKLH